MSIEALGAVLGSRVYEGAPFSVLIALANLAGEDGECWPSHEYIGGVGRITARSARRGLKILFADGAVVAKTFNSGRGRHNRYWLDVKRFAKAASAAQAARDQAMKRAGATAEDGEKAAKAAGEAAFGPRASQSMPGEKADTESGLGEKNADTMSGFSEKADTMSGYRAENPDTMSGLPEKIRTPCPGFGAEQDTMSGHEDTESGASPDTESGNTSITINNTEAGGLDSQRGDQTDRPAVASLQGGAGSVSVSPAKPTQPKSLTLPVLQALNERLGEETVAAYIAPCTFDGHRLYAKHAFAREKLLENSFHIRGVLGEHVTFAVQARPMGAP